MRERRRDYELIFIISPLRSSEEDITTTIDRVQQSITAASGQVVDTDQTAPWGRRKFAYPIREYAEGEASRRSFNEGHYVLCHFSLPTTRIPELERSLKLNDAVLRYLLTLVDTRGQAAGVKPAAGAPSGAGASEAVADEDEDEFEGEDEDTDDEEA
jgi:small subunit ribosomal protein S6